MEQVLGNPSIFKQLVLLVWRKIVKEQKILKEQKKQGEDIKIAKNRM